jgi:hypothetical protein
VGPRAGLDEVDKILAPTGTRTGQPVASCYPGSYHGPIKGKRNSQWLAGMFSYIIMHFSLVCMMATFLGRLVWLGASIVVMRKSQPG